MVLAGLTGKILFMRPSSSRLIWLCTALAAAAAPQIGWTDAKENPFQRIVDRNLFALKPPVTQTEAPPPAPLVPPAKVTLTGITSLFGPSSKRALFVIVEQEPGKVPVSKSPILREGERDGMVEVLSIDVEKSIVRIRNGGTETNITFELAKDKPATGAVPPTGFVPPPAAQFNPAQHNAAAQGQGAPMIIGGNGNTANPGSGRGVMVMGGSSSGAGFANPGGVPGVTASATGYINPAGAQSYGGGVQPSSPYIGGGGGGGSSIAPGTTQGAAAGLRQLPSRQIRTDSSPTAGPKQMSREESFIQMELQRQIQERAAAGGRTFPPLPPTPLTPQFQPAQ